MAILDQEFRTVTCDGCGKTVTFEKKNIAQAVDENPWMKTLRITQTAEGRNFAYHDDECEIKSVAEGNHNPAEQKRVSLETGANALEQAKANARAVHEATRAMKEGKGLHLVETQG